MMEAHDIERQADTFLRMFRHERGTDWEDAFEKWAGPDGKDFAQRDYLKIYMLVRGNLEQPEAA